MIAPTNLYALTEHALRDAVQAHVSLSGEAPTVISALIRAGDLYLDLTERMPLTDIPALLDYLEEHHGYGVNLFVRGVPFLWEPGFNPFAAA